MAERRETQPQRIDLVDVEWCLKRNENLLQRLEDFALARGWLTPDDVTQLRQIRGEERL
jgi:hypothetical protein